ncbi:MAG TPA: PKD domain-containing protein [Blastocatellia bacterium]|nr:PKD domain-containing protein [Blastocatellia bacterium]
MNFARRSLGLILALLLIGVVAQSQTPRSPEDPRNPAPTVTGGTGLFTVYDAQTLRKGEFNIGFFANHFHRDPGDLTWQVYPVNFQVGFSDHLEIFGYFEAQRVVTSGSPALLSGFYFPDVRTPGLPVGRVVVIPGTNTVTLTTADPCGNGGFLGPCAGPNRGPFVARPSGNDTAVYPGLGAPVGGILPAIPPNNLPNYYPNAPFLSRRADHQVGNVWIGGKVRLTGPENSVGFALVPLVKIPTTQELNTGLQRGRGAGGFDFGLIAAVDGRLSRYINLSANVGFIKKGDPRAEDMNFGPLCVACGVIQGFGSSERSLDLPNELRAGVGFDFPLSQYLQLIAEVNSTTFVGSRTPSLQENDPVDLVAGARIFPARWFAISAAYQRHLNWFSDRDTVHEPDGFIFGFSLGHLNSRGEPPPPPPPPNQPPVVALTVGPVTPGSADLLRASASTVCAGDKVALAAAANDPNGDALLFSWKSSGGRVIGQGANTQFDTAGLNPGDYTVTIEVSDGHGGVASDSKTIRVEACPPLTVCFGPNLEVTAVPASAEAGEKINLSTTGVTAGRNYGAVRYEWRATAGTVSGSGMTAVLDTTGAASGSSIDVTVTATSEAGGCSASGSTRVTVKTPPPPPKKPTYSEIGQCTTFKRNNARVDNACKEILQNRVVPALQADPTARLVVDGYRADSERPAGLDMQRAKNLRDRLADGSLNVQIDVNRISVRPGGVSVDGNQVKIFFVPSGAADPPGPSTVDAGPVTPEKKAAPQPKKKAAPQPRGRR